MFTSMPAVFLFQSLSSKFKTLAEEFESLDLQDTKSQVTSVVLISTLPIKLEPL